MGRAEFASVMMFPFLPPCVVGFLEPSQAMRPVFLILMGAALLLVAWRLARRRVGWGTRLLMAGALLLAAGYSVILPLYEARVLVSVENLRFYPEVEPSAAFAWQLVKLVAMNGGWFLFGVGLVLHARLMETPAAPVKTVSAS